MAVGFPLCSAERDGITRHRTNSRFRFRGQYSRLNATIPEVLTTTRLRQPKTRVPGSTTVIAGDLIRDLGIRSLYEVFRLVPGMVVNFVGSHQPVVTYHAQSTTNSGECRFW